jgi:hypothetical protein
VQNSYLVLFEGLAVDIALSPISSQLLIPGGISSSPMQHTKQPNPMRSVDTVSRIAVSHGTGCQQALNLPTDTAATMLHISREYRASLATEHRSSHVLIQRRLGDTVCTLVLLSSPLRFLTVYSRSITPHVLHHNHYRT